MISRLTYRKGGRTNDIMCDRGTMTESEKARPIDDGSTGSIIIDYNNRHIR